MRTGPTPAFLDTSYIVRYLIGDQPEMAERAAQLIDSDEILVLSEIVLVETAYVLSSHYSVPRAEIVDRLIDLVQRANLRLAALPKAGILEALSLCRNSKRFSFTDALLWAQAVEMGAERIYTFDRRFPSQRITTQGM